MVSTAIPKTKNHKEKVKQTVTSQGKKKSVQLNNKITAAEGTQNTSFDLHLDNTTFTKKFEILKLDFINYFEELTILQIFVSLLTLLIGFSLYQYRSYIFTFEDSGSQYALPLDQINPEKEKETAPNSDTFKDRDNRYDYPLDQRYPGRDEETASNFNDDDLALITASAMVYSYLENLANEIKTSKPKENIEKYLSENFLQRISDRIAEDGFMRSNFQELLSAETLVKLGQIYYELNRNPGKSEQVSTNTGSNDIVTHKCKGNLKDVKVNLDVKVGGQELKILV